ncbi:MAG: T9SS type A sorting domain-containing protein [Prevotellaceae bacterium]|jgi:hypothetical protein|nr:T9SS type A sorting domain-containing protein [Prevotellaceae bacterium]
MATKSPPPNRSLFAAPLSAYPNPTTGVVYVENGSGGEVALYSVKGELLRRTHGSKVDLSSYTAGAYIIRVGNKSAKVVKVN